MKMNFLIMCFHVTTIPTYEDDCHMLSGLVWLSFKRAKNVTHYLEQQMSILNIKNLRFSFSDFME